MSWTDERVEKLKELWAEGMSASKIAKELGGVTRNAVIGKVHRLGLSNRNGAGAASEAAETPAAPASAAEPIAEAPPVAEPEPEPAPAPVPVRREPVIRDASQPRPPGLPTPEEESARATLVEIEKMARKLSLLELTERTCKWPIGDPT
ncbi:MAG: GcrA family cell cycle regulator, partial [Pseudomonadota bacterium]